MQTNNNERETPHRGEGPAATPVLEISHLTVGSEDPSRAPILEDLSLTIAPGEILGLVGESGAGKSMMGAALAGLLPQGIVRRAGTVALDGRRLDNLTAREFREVRGRGIGFVFQDPLTSLNPLMTIGTQLEETIRTLLDAKESPRREALRLLAEVGLPEPEDLLGRHPHELSGGMRQRVVIALALAGNPRLIVADEPTTALDAARRTQVMTLLRQLAHERRIAVLLITHDMSVAASFCDRAAVLYSGRLVEVGPADEVFTRARHPYAQGLIRAVPSVSSKAGRPFLLDQIDGTMPPPEQRPSGCAFHPRCPSALPECGRTVPELLQLRNRHGGRSESPHLVACPYAHTAEPPATSTGSTSLRVKGNSSTGISGRTRSTTPADTGEILRVENLSKHFDKETFFSRAARALKLGTASRKKVFALNDASLTVRRGETVAVVGESGSGKSTLARIVAGLLRPDAGQVRFVGTNGRPRIAMIFQDPYASLNPRMTAGETIEEALRIYAPALDTDARRRRALELLTHVGLPADAHRRRPHEFSGGQRQRISIARALACEPDLLLCDEPTSALDVSVQAQILNLLKTLQREHAMSMLFISHDLGVVRHMCDRVAVMRQGRIVECDTREAVFGTPKHPYTRMLLASGAVSTPSR